MSDLMEKLEYAEIVDNLPNGARGESPYSPPDSPVPSGSPPPPYIPPPPPPEVEPSAPPTPTKEVEPPTSPPLPMEPKDAPARDAVKRPKNLLLDKVKKLPDKEPPHTPRPKDEEKGGTESVKIPPKQGDTVVPPPPMFAEEVPKPELTPPEDGRSPDEERSMRAILEDCEKKFGFKYDPRDPWTMSYF